FFCSDEAKKQLLDSQLVRRLQTRVELLGLVRDGALQAVHAFIGRVQELAAVPLFPKPQENELEQPQMARVIANLLENGLGQTRFKGQTHFGGRPGYGELEFGPSHWANVNLSVLELVSEVSIGQCSADEVAT